MNPGQQVVPGCQLSRDRICLRSHKPRTILSRDILGREFNIFGADATMLSNGTNIVLLCAILTNITVIIALLQ